MASYTPARAKTPPHPRGHQGYQHHNRTIHGLRTEDRKRLAIFSQFSRQNCSHQPRPTFSSHVLQAFSHVLQAFSHVLHSSATPYRPPATSSILQPRPIDHQPRPTFSRKNTLSYNEDKWRQEMEMETNWNKKWRHTDSRHLDIFTSALHLNISTSAVLNWAQTKWLLTIPMKLGQ